MPLISDIPVLYATLVITKLYNLSANCKSAVPSRSFNFMVGLITAFYFASSSDMNQFSQPLLG